MTASELLLAVINLYAAVWSSYLILLPILGRFGKKKETTDHVIVNTWPTVVVIVPGSNVARVVGDCIRALHTCDYPEEKISIYVIADHCSDDTSREAQAAGASVLSRTEGTRGKTYAIAWTLKRFADLGIDADLYVIVDATARVDPKFIKVMVQHWCAGEHIITNHTTVASENRSWHARCLALMFVHRNLQNRNRERLGLSAMLGGCGMAFSKQYIDRFGWSLALPKTNNSHPTEDWRHAVRAAHEGYRVCFADKARVATPLRRSLYESTQQGARWERGRLINAISYAASLLTDGVLQRDCRKIFAALDALQPPVAILSTLTIGLAFSVILDLFPSYPLSFLAIPSAATMCAYAALVVAIGAQEGVPVRTAFWGPLYLAWRCTSFALAWVFLDRFRFEWRRRPSANPKKPA